MKKERTESAHLATISRNRKTNRTKVTAKGTILTLVCSEINLPFVPNDTLWVDAGAATHLSMSMQACLWS